MSETQKLIYKKMSDVMRDIKAITKDQKNTAQGFKFRGIDQFVNALYPALTRHGVFMVPSCEKEQHELKEVVRSNGKPGIDKHVNIMMSYTFIAEDGSWVKAGPVPAEGLDSGDKATNKALSAALKYALIQTFSVPTEDMAEADRESPEIGTDSPVVSTKRETAGLSRPVNTSEVKSTIVTTGPDQPALVVSANPEAPKKLPTFRKPAKPVEATSTPNQTEEWT